MRYLLMLCGLLVLLCGCRQAAATPVPPAVAADPTPDDLINAFHEAGLRAYPDKSSTVYNTVQQPGLVSYQAFTLSQINGTKHVVVEYDTIANAEAARAKNSNNFTAGYRRGKLVLVWWYYNNAEPVGLYFTILQTMNR